MMCLLPAVKAFELVPTETYHSVLGNEIPEAEVLGSFCQGNSREKNH